MYTDFETRSNVLEKWLLLTDFTGIESYLSFYIKYGVLSRPSDLYKLGARHLYLNSDISNEEVHMTLECIEKTKSLSLARVLLCLLPDLEIDSIREAVISPCTIEELVEKCGKSEFAGELLEELYRLEQLGIELTFGDDNIFDEIHASPFTGKKVVLSGKLSASDDIVKDALESLGAEIQDKLTKETDYLIIGEGADKVNLAKEIGTNILTENDIAAMLGLDA